MLAAWWSLLGVDPCTIWGAFLKASQQRCVRTGTRVAFSVAHSCNQAVNQEIGVSHPG